MGEDGRVSDLIDTTEMYLRTIYELVEEGITPLRARIAERLHQSGPTVSQTVARMERDGLLLVELLDHPTQSPYGNPIPGLDELGEIELGEEFMAGVEPLSKAASDVEARV